MSLRPNATVGMAALYGLIVALAVIWVVMTGRPSLFMYPGSEPATLPQLPPSRMGIMIVLGIAAGVMVATASLLASRHIRWFGLLDDFFVNLIGGFSIPELVLMVLLGSVAEELFFRGAMQPGLGLVAQALVFAALHTGPRRLFFFLLPWTLMAFATGLFFGWMFMYTGCLLAPIAAHLTVNALGIIRMRMRMRRDDVPTMDEVILRFEDKG